MLEQDYPDIEYIIVDGGSTGWLTGNHPEIRRTPGLVGLRTGTGGRRTPSTKAARASGEILAWLNSDDTYTPMQWPKQWISWNATRWWGWCMAKRTLLTKTTASSGVSAAQTDYARLRRGYVHIPQQAAFWRADLWRQVGPLDPSVLLRNGL